MKRFALIGCGIGYTRSPFIHSKIVKRAGADLDTVYDVFDIPPQELPERIEYIKQNCDGFNVTKPYKTEIVKYLDRLDKSADTTGAVNTAARRPNGKWIGYNTDGAGFADSLAYHKIDLRNKNALILGAGGAARIDIQ